MRLRRISLVQQRTRDPFLIFRNDSRSTATWLLCIPVEPTRARVHSSNKLKVRRKSEGAFRSAAGDDLVLHRLAHDFEGALEFLPLHRFEYTELAVLRRLFDTLATRLLHTMRLTVVRSNCLLGRPGPLCRLWAKLFRPNVFKWK